MRKIWIVALMAIVTVSCFKDDLEDPKCQYQDVNFTAPATEITNMLEYLEVNNIIATRHASGMFYIIQSAGDASRPDVCSNISAKYVGMLTNGTIFDQSQGSNTLNIVLGQLILGWQKGLPLIGKGGKIRLFIPPSMGYGANGVPGAIPGNSILIFDVELVTFQ
jgi:FKBP-type peptidyl-prolyl cis-trans isomerase FkpA